MSLVVSATTVSVFNLLRTRSKAVARQQAFSRAAGAADRIALDVVASVRHWDLYSTRVQITDSGRVGSPHDELLVLAQSLRPVRGLEDIAEGGTYECQYRIDGSGDAAGLWRRVDPAFDLTQDGGGIAALLGPSVTSLSLECSDGQAWYEQWDSDTDGYPHAMRIVVTASSNDETATATSRRVVALDRTPLPYEPPTMDETTADEQGQPTSGGESGGGTPSGASGGGTPRPAPSGGGGGPRGGGGVGGGNGGGPGQAPSGTPRTAPGGAPSGPPPAGGAPR